MIHCPSCGAQAPDAASLCSVCGGAISSVSRMPTALAPSPDPGVRSLASADGFASAAAFTPGHLIGGRYRIVGLLGRGGMGEVYRADDLKLGQPVAIKFLPRDVENDPRALERFHAEVRNARQVSHPHVCRVYDIGDIEGRHFLTMEYVDGEDLAALLRRIGSLPSAKGVKPILS